MEKFISHHAARVTCTLSGFDRLVFRGSLLPLMPDRAMFHFLTRAGVRLLDFKDFVSQTSDRVKEAALAQAEKQKRPVVYLESSKTSKEDLAKKLLAEHPLDKPGLVCAFKVVEPCMSLEYHRSQDPKERGLKLRPRKCLHIYKYFVHPSFGFMNARIQTWFPFSMQVCLNGREWLARQLQRRHSGFTSNDNCFPALANPTLAQRLMDEQLETDWPAALTMIARALNPLHDEIFQASPMDYYWSCARTSLAEEEAHVAKPKLRTATRGENPTGDDEDRHAGSESCEIVRKYTGDRDLEALDSERVGRAMGSRNVYRGECRGFDQGRRRQKAGMRDRQGRAPRFTRTTHRDRRTGHVRKGCPGTWDGVSALRGNAERYGKDETEPVGRREVGARSRS